VSEMADDFQQDGNGCCHPRRRRILTRVILANADLVVFDQVGRVAVFAGFVRFSLDTAAVVVEWA